MSGAFGTEPYGGFGPEEGEPTGLGTLGTLDGTLPTLTGELAGEVAAGSSTGVLSGSLPAVTGVLAGEVTFLDVPVVWTLSLTLDYDYLAETPSGLAAHISNGAPGELVTFSVVGAVANFQTVTLDDNGLLDLIVQVPALPAGEFTLRAVGTDSGTDEVAFTTRDDALVHDDTSTTPDAPPARDPAQHWRFYDLRDAELTWTFPRNPKTWSNVYPPNDFTHDTTTAPDGQALTWQGAARPWPMEFSGWLDTQEEHDALAFWSQLHRRFWLIDHRNRAWLITVESFDPIAQVKPNNPWAHEYTVKTLVFMQGTD